MAQKRTGATGRNPLEQSRLLDELRRHGLENERLDLAIARAHGVALSDLKALDVLSVRGELTPGELARHMQLTTGAVTALIDRVEAAGWVERLPHPTDRRSVVLTLTDRAWEIGVAEWGPYGDELQELVAGLSDRDRKAIERFLAAAAEVAARHADRRAAQQD